LRLSIALVVQITVRISGSKLRNATNCAQALSHSLLTYAGLLGAAIAVIAWILKLVAEKEYPYWAPRLAERLIRTATLLLPRSTRAQHREEWLAVFRTWGSVGSGR
jgi:hypothetical protein